MENQQPPILIPTADVNRLLFPHFSERMQTVGVEDVEFVGQGWNNILLELHENLTKINPDYRIVQVKEKMGGLRFYLAESTPEMNKHVDEAERASMKTCEECGREGDLFNDKGWFRTVCAEHAVAREEMFDEEDTDFVI